MGAGEDETDGDRRETALDRVAPGGAAEALPQPRDGAEQQARRQEEGDRRDQRAEPSRDLPADQRDDEDAGAGGGAGNGEKIDELPPRQPVIDVDGLMRHLGEDG